MTYCTNSLKALVQPIATLIRKECIFQLESTIAERHIFMAREKQDQSLQLMLLDSTNLHVVHAVNQPSFPIISIPYTLLSNPSTNFSFAVVKCWFLKINVWHRAVILCLAYTLWVFCALLLTCYHNLTYPFLFCSFFIITGWTALPPAVNDNFFGKKKSM